MRAPRLVQLCRPTVHVCVQLALGVMPLMTLSTACARSAPRESASPTAHAPAASSSASTEEFAEEVSGPATPEGKPSGRREYVSDVTRTVGVKGRPEEPGETKKLRVVVRFTIPKVRPANAREPHVINRLLWDVRKQIASCFYNGVGRDPGPEMGLVAWLDVSKRGELTGSGVENADSALSANANADRCIMQSLQGLTFIPTGDDVRIRFKLKLQTLDGTGLADFKEAPPIKKEKE